MRNDHRTHTLKVVLWTVVGTVAVLVIALLIVPYTGAIDVAAAEAGASPALDWYLETTRENTISARAEEIVPPADLGSAERIERGLVAYHHMCVMCHGAPGVEAGWIARGLDPPPPRLAEASERELGDARAAMDYWVIENGIRMTGMAALAPTHSEEEMWDLVAFLQRLPEMTPEAYASAVTAAGMGGASASGHGHDGGQGHEEGDEAGSHEHEGEHPHG